MSLDIETIENIIDDEGGCRVEPYFCTAGKATWLIGRNVIDRPLDAVEWKILAEQGLCKGARTLFNIEIVNLRNHARYHWETDNMPEEVEIIILNMLYNMGTSRFNPQTWPKFFAALKAKDYKKAAEEMMDSKWYGQVRFRGQRLRDSMLRISVGRIQ